MSLKRKAKKARARRAAIEKVRNISRNNVGGSARGRRITAAFAAALLARARR